MFIDKVFDSKVKISATAMGDDTLDKLAGHERVAVWGTGGAGKYAIQILKQRGINLEYIVDSFQHEKNETFEGFPLFNGPYKLSDDKEIIVLVCCLGVHGIPNELERIGVRYLTWDTHLLETFLYDTTFAYDVKKNSEKIEHVYSRIGDERSKEVYEKILKYRLTVDKAFLKGIIDTNLYFNNDLITKVDIDSFVDCGAYNGDTLRQFEQALTCKCKQYFAIEPNDKEREMLQKYIEQAGLEEKVTALPFVVWNEDTKVNFVCKAFGGSEVVESVNDCGFEARRVDTLLNDGKDHVLGFLKMDIEGSELQALEGAACSIKKDHPIIATSVYHRRSDLWEIPEYIMGLYPEYKLGFRHYSQYCDDTVMYAIP